MAAAFNAGAISSDGSVLLLREVNRQVNLLGRVSAVVPDPRNRLFVEHGQRTMIAQRVLVIACGWEDLNDQDGLRHDPVMQLATGREASGPGPGQGDVDPGRPLASAPTLCRLENRVDRQACVAINKLLVDLFVESHQTPPDEVVLDFDATDDPVHGQQPGRFLHGYYGHYCYLPPYVFAGDRLPCAYLRPSNIDESRHARATPWLIARRLRQAWPAVRVVFRGDGGFCPRGLTRPCDRRGVGYVIGLPKNQVLNRMAAELSGHAEAIFTLTNRKQRPFGEFRYAAGTWDRQRRVIARIGHADEGRNPRYVVTNLDRERRALYDQTYCGRGEMENRIKEQQLGLFADRTSCRDLVANQFRLLLSSKAYVLVETLRRIALAGTELAIAQATTIRLKLLKIGAVVRRSVRRLAAHLSESFPLREPFQRLVVRLSG